MNLQAPGKKIEIDPHNIDEKSIHQAARVIEAGGIVAYPTETYYALGVDALNRRALEKVFGVKGRTFSKPLTVIVGQRESLHSLVMRVDPLADKLMQRFWPGPLTIIFEAFDRVPALLTAGTHKVGVRVSSYSIARALASAVGGPITATSANPSGAEGLTKAEDVCAALGEEIDLILDGGETQGGLASTIVDTTLSPPVLLRAGAIGREMVEEYLGLRLLAPD